ncbi:MAG: efflux RND transporter permease subunit [Clostridiales bacterium]|jgi:HAE1 family hydrophobic/amphiphilic exporter-1|nr:efflux RND transporter permease subunit [Clostridiales bacterium]
MQSLIKFAVTRKVTVIMLIAAVVLLGTVSWSRTPVDLFPDITFPGAAVMVSYPGAAPEEVEQHVTQVLEGSLGTLTNVREIQSVSREGSATIILMFNWGADMDAAAVEMRENLDQVARFLPSDVSAPTIFKFDPSMMPVMSVAVASDSYDMVELTRLSTIFAQRLERLEGVASVSISGGLSEEITVIVDAAKLQEYNIPLSAVTNALRIANINIPGGNVMEEGTRWLIRTVVRTQAVEEIEGLMVGMKTVAVPGQPQPVPVPVYVKDVAKVSLQSQQQAVINRVNRIPNLSLSISKRSDANTVLTANQIKTELETLGNEYEGISFIPTEDQSFFVELSISSLVRNALIGGALALLILLFFLRNMRSTLIIALSIPVSLISTFILMFFAGLTVNMMTLGGLALGVGMLVDNSIVVIENIFRHLQNGKSSQDAAFEGTREVGMAITASTLTTVAVFLPVVFVGGIAGIFFRDLALTVSFALLASLGVALTVIPMFSAALLRPGMGDAITKASGIAPLYRRALSFVLRRKSVTLAVVAALFVASLLMVPRLGGEMIPAFDEGTGRVNILMPSDTKIADTEAVVRQIEELLISDPNVEIVSTTIGSGSGQMGSIMGGGGQSVPNRARVSFQLRPVEARDLSTQAFIAQLEEKLPLVPEAQITVSAMRMAGGGMLGGSGIEVELRGRDLETLGEHAGRLEGILSELDYVASTENSLAARNPEVQVRLDLERALMMGVNPMVVGSAIRSAFQGETATRITRDGYELAVVVKMQDDQRDSLTHISDVIVSTQGGRIVRVGDVAEVERAQGPRVINRRNNQRTVTVTANLTEGKDLISARRDIQAAVDGLSLPAGYSASFRGQVLEMQTAFSGMLLALALAVALVYMVMASQFESFIHPLTVMFTLPLAAIGVIFTLLMTGQKLSIPSLIGVVMLAGVVVNNAIVLIDYVNQLRGRGLDLNSALLEAGETRLRPILMTTLTTVLALMPLALGIGSGAEMQQPLALTVMGGLTVGALLTLFVIPLIYSIFDRLLPKATNIVQTQTHGK